jgi:hypothetical protein
MNPRKLNRTVREVVANFEAFDEPDELVFRLARRLRGIGVTEAESCRNAIKLFCRLTGTTFLDSWAGFVEAFEKVRFPDAGQDALAWAAERAKKEPLAMTREPPAPQYAFVGAIAYHLSKAMGDEPFFLPGPRLATMLGCRKTTISNILSWLKRNGVIDCADESYSFNQAKGQNRCKRYLFVMDLVTEVTQKPKLPKITEATEGVSISF